MKALLALTIFTMCFSFAATAAPAQLVKLKGQHADQLASLLKSGAIGAVETSLNNRSSLPDSLIYELGEFSCTSHRLSNQSDVITAPTCTGTVASQAMAMVMLLDEDGIADTGGTLKNPEERFRFDIEIKSIICKINTTDLTSTCEVQPGDSLN
jgi:hypothetical protein